MGPEFIPINNLLQQKEFVCEFFEFLSFGFEGNGELLEGIHPLFSLSLTLERNAALLTALSED